MIVRTYRQVIKAVPSEYVYVATESQKIKNVCEKFNIKVLMTSEHCLTGTDRVAECVEMLPHIETFINVQGDEPVFEPEDIKKILETSSSHPDKVINGYCRIDDSHQFFSGNIPKVVFRPDGRLLYISRAAIPSNKQLDCQVAHRQVCCYAFPSLALKEFKKFNMKSPLEKIEDIEILRFLELGYEVQMISMSTNSIAVDVMEDIREVEFAIINRKL